MKAMSRGISRGKRVIKFANTSNCSQVCFIESFRLRRVRVRDLTSSFVRVLKKKTARQASIYFFSPKKLVRLFILKEVKPSPDSKMIKLLTFDNLFPPLQHSR